MPWEQRGGKRYYYRAERVDGRSRRRYLGTGLVGELAAAVDTLHRLSRAIEAREHRTEQARYLEAERSLLRLCELTDVLSRAALVAAGFRQHARGPWRRRREPKGADGNRHCERE